MRKSVFVVGLLVLMAAAVVAQEYPKVETAPGFMYIRNTTNLSQTYLVNGTPVSTGNNAFNCAGGGGTIGYNFSSLVGVGADLGGCKFFGNTLGLGNTLNGNQFTFFFGPRLKFRGHSPLEPFFDLGFGGDRLSTSCQNSASNCITRFGTGSYSKTAFALVVGGGVDIKINKKFSVRPAELQYMLTRFGNNCALAICNQNNSQNNFRLKSGIVIGWGGSASSSN